MTASRRSTALLVVLGGALFLVSGYLWKATLEIGTDATAVPVVNEKMAAPAVPHGVRIRDASEVSSWIRGGGAQFPVGQVPPWLPYSVLALQDGNTPGVEEFFDDCRSVVNAPARSHDHYRSVLRMTTALGFMQHADAGELLIDVVLPPLGAPAHDERAQAEAAAVLGSRARAHGSAATRFLHSASVPDEVLRRFLVALVPSPCHEDDVDAILAIAGSDRGLVVRGLAAATAVRSSTSDERMAQVDGCTSKFLRDVSGVVDAHAIGLDRWWEYEILATLDLIDACAEVSMKRRVEVAPPAGGERMIALGRVVRAATRGGDAAESRELRRWARSHADPIVRSASTFSIGRVGTEEDLAILVAIREEDPFRMRSSADGLEVAPVRSAAYQSLERLQSRLAASER